MLLHWEPLKKCLSLKESLLNTLHLSTGFRKWCLCYQGSVFCVCCNFVWCSKIICFRLKRLQLGGNRGSINSSNSCSKSSILVAKTIEVPPFQSALLLCRDAAFLSLLFLFLLRTPPQNVWYDVSLTFNYFFVKISWLTISLPYAISFFNNFAFSISQSRLLISGSVCLVEIIIFLFCSFFHFDYMINLC